MGTPIATARTQAAAAHGDAAHTSNATTAAWYSTDTARKALDPSAVPAPAAAFGSCTSRK
jgi:hypothetical protein